MDEDLIKKIEKIYNECKESFTPENQLTFNYSKLKDDEKKRFFMYVSDYFLKERQRDVIENEKY